MARKVLSIEVGIWWTKVAYVEYQKKNPKVFNIFYMETPEHAVEDGYIRDKEAFGITLKRELSRRRISERETVFSINSSKVITRDIMIPFVKDNKIPGIVETQAKDYFPMDVSAYTIAYNKMDTVTVDGAKQIRLLLVAVPDNLLSNYATFAESVGLEIEAFEYMGNSVLQIMGRSFMYNSMVVQMEEQTTIISILSDKKLVFQRVTPYGYATALSAAMDHPVLEVDDEREAFAFLESHNVLYSTPKASDYPESRISDPQRRQNLLEEAYADLQEALRYHIRMVSTALDYYQNQTKQEFRGKIHLMGDGARISGIRKSFEDEVPLDLDRAEYLDLIHFANKSILKELPDASGAGLVSLVGAAIQPLNIVPKAMRERAKKKSKRHDYVFILIVAAAVSFGLTFMGMFRLMTAQEEMQALQREYASLTYIEAIYQENERVKQAAEWYLAFDRATAARNERLGELIEALEERLPKEVTVQNLTIAEDNISMNLTCDVKLEAAQLLWNLRDIPYLENIAIPTMAEQVNEEAGTAAWQFSVTAVYIDPNALPEETKTGTEAGAEAEAGAETEAGTEGEE